MINIKKGNHTLKVSRDTYESMFKIMGYVVVDNEKEEANKKASSKEVKKDNKDLSNEKSNLSNEEKDNVKINSDEKDDNLESIIGMLSNDSKEKNKKK